MFPAAAHRRLTLPRPLAWLLLWVALVLPVAQAVAAGHVYSHTSELPAGSTELIKNKHATGAPHCDLCLAGSVVHGGSLPSAELLPFLPLPDHAAPAAAFDSPWTPPFVPAYQGRAPPIALN